MYATYLKKLVQPGQTVNPLFACLGIEVVGIEKDRAELRLPFQDGFVQGAGIVAGGVVAALTDEAMAHAVVPSLKDGERCATVELSVRYLNGVRPGESLTAEASVVKRGRSVVFVECVVSSSSGAEAARADAVFLVTRAM